MERIEWMHQTMELAKAKGCSDAEALCVDRDTFSVSALNGDIDRYNVSKTGGVSLRVQQDGRDGYAYTERMSEPEQLVERAMDNARCMETANAHPMQSPQTYEQVAQPENPLALLSPEQRIAMAVELEQKTLVEDARVKKVVSCCVQTGESGLILQNTKGMSAQRSSSMALCYVEPLVEQDGEVQTGFAFRMGAEAGDLSGCAREAVADALQRLKGEPVPSGVYPVVIQNMVMAELLAAFSGMFSAEEAQKGCSLLADRQGEIIGADCVTLLDDPFDPAAPHAFDDEGTPTQTKDIIRNGKFCTLLHNLKTAAKAGVASTGNGVRASAASPVEVGPWVLRLQPGTAPFEALLGRMGDGLLITDLQGLHAGLNAVSGDFSLKATGRRIAGGKDVGAVSGITLAGNFLTLLQTVDCVGNDVRFTLPSACYAASPSVLVTQLRVAGE